MLPEHLCTIESDFETLTTELNEVLLIAWKIRQGLRKHVPYNILNAYVQFEWQHTLEPLFLAEERCICNLLDPFDGLRLKAEVEHHHIRQQACATPGNGESDDACCQVLGRFADMLQEVTYFEDSMLFPVLKSKIAAGRCDRTACCRTTKNVTRKKQEWTNAFLLPVN